MAQQQNGRRFDNEPQLAIIRAYYETGDEQLLNPVFVEIDGLVRRYLRARQEIYNQELLDELTQQTLDEVLKTLHCGTLDASIGTNLGAWICVIAKFRCSKVRRNSRTTPSTPGFDEDPFLLLSGELVSQPEDRPISAEAEKRAAAALAAATRALLTLEPAARKCVHLHYYHGVPVKEGAKQLGITAEQFTQRLEMGVASLRTWARQNPHLAPSDEEYKALARVNTGTLFTDTDEAQQRREANDAKNAQNRQARQFQDRTALNAKRREKEKLKKNRLNESG